MKGQRKLTAIMFTDIVGYTQMSAQNEQAALNSLSLNTKLHQQLVKKHQGEVLKEIGDGTLSTFRSAVDAANCAIAIQRESSLNKQYQLRVGLHIGDVFASSNDIVGNSVNIAARIQGATLPGSIAMSEVFFDAIASQSNIESEYLGPTTLKGIERPVNLYALKFSSDKTIDYPKISIAEASESSPWSIKVTAAVVFPLSIVLIVFLFWYFAAPVQMSAYKTSPSTASTDSAASIAVLPFRDFTEKQDQQYFGDGLAEELLNLLAKIDGLKVAARTSSFALKNIQSDIKSIGQQLDVSHVLEGSIRRSGNKLRITAQLIKTHDGYHLWSETYDRSLDDVFSIQDEIALAVTQSLKPFLGIEAIQLPTSNRTANFEAYDAYLKGLSYLHSPQNSGNIKLATGFFQQALTLDEKYASAHAGLCQAKVVQYQIDNSNTDIISATSSCLKALELDASQKEVHIALGHFHHTTGNYIAALDSFNKALAIDPVNMDAMLGMAKTYISNNDGGKAEEIYLRLIQQSPKSWHVHNQLGQFYLQQGQVNEAINQFKQAISLSAENSSSYANLGTAYYYLGENEHAMSNWKTSLKYQPDAGVYSNLGSLYFQNSQFEDAITMFKHAIELVPSFAIYWGNLADALYFSENKENAEATYQQAIRLSEKNLTTNPKDVASLSTLALYYARTHQVSKAESYINQAFSLAPSDVNVLYYAALVYFEIEQEELGWQRLELAVAKGYPSELLAQTPELKKYHPNDRYKKLIHVNPH